MNNIYEFGYWLKIDSDLKEDLERIKKVFSNFQGEIVFEDSPKKKNLAYPIKKQKVGYFGYLIFKIEEK
ncbi:MAG: 30S ribosomal protein S6, partial [Patescibacteria group bacterium]|nr:30S ribosomal protein S6 [Patescibacteria group bacterium]